MKERNTSITPFDERKWRHIMTNAFKFDDDPSQILHLYKNDIEKIETAQPPKQEELLKRLNDPEYSQRICSMCNLERHSLLAETTTGKFRPLIIEMAKRLITEHSCSKADEKALAQLIASAYVRSIQFASYLNNLTTKNDYLSSERNGMMAVLSKEVDRAQRQYMSGLTLLKQLKQPPIKVNIKSDNAFISEKQEFQMRQSDNYEQPTP